MEYTQEQLDALVSDAVNKATQGLLTEDDFNRKVTQEVDRRVETGIQKGLETQKKKWETEFSQKAKMTAEELANQELSGKMSEIEARERELSKRANMLNAKDLLTGASIPTDQYSKFIDVLVNDDEEVTKSNVTNFIDMFNTTKESIANTIRSEYTNVTPPGQGGAKALDKDSFKKMSYGERLELKKSDPDTYNSLIK